MSKTIANKLSLVYVAKGAIKNAINGVAKDKLATGATTPAAVGDKIEDYAGAIANLGSVLNASITEKLDWLSASGAALDKYYTDNSKSAVVGSNYSKLSGEIATIVAALQTADIKDASLKGTLEGIAAAHNALVEAGVEEIPAEKQGTGVGKYNDLAAYKESLKLVLPAEDATAAEAAAVYEQWPANMIKAATVEASELSVIASVVAEVNKDVYGVASNHKLPTAEADFISVVANIQPALADILAKGVSNNNQALKEAVADDKDAAGAAVIAADDASEAGYIGKVHAAIADWMDAGADFKAKVNEGIAAVNAKIVEAGNANNGTAIADEAPDQYGVIAKAAFDKYAAEIERLNGEFDDATAFKANIREQVNAESATEVGDTYEAIEAGLEALHADYHKQLNRILWGTDNEPAAASE